MGKREVKVRDCLGITTDSNLYREASVKTCRIFNFVYKATELYHAREISSFVTFVNCMIY